eukprot:m.236521 g.236521  ORF g.236521 m.236521 type:complete len:100 (+) comp18940_c0_seq5:686-985(+)
MLSALPSTRFRTTLAGVGCWASVQGRSAEAKSILCKASSPEEAAETLESLAKEAASETKVTWLDLVFAPDPVLRHLVYAAIGVAFFQQATGIEGTQRLS